MNQGGARDPEARGDPSAPSLEARFCEDELLPLSALQHLVFCERQCALIHIERVWADNAFTVEGSALHESVDRAPPETRRSLRIVRDLPLRSTRLGLVGRTDVVEFHRLEPGSDPALGTRLPGHGGLWTPFPVEYKRGRPKRHRADEVQLCAQAMCLEEALGMAVPEGALFYGKTRRRKDVRFDEALRLETEAAASRLHDLLRSRVTPPAVYEKRKCLSCSLFDLCRPRAADRSARRYVEAIFRGQGTAIPEAM